jgi:hypothetical protein
LECASAPGLEVRGRYEQAPVELDEAEEEERSSISEEQLTSAPNAESGVSLDRGIPGHRVAGHSQGGCGLQQCKGMIGERPNSSHRSSGAADGLRTGL